MTERLKPSQDKKSWSGARRVVEGRYLDWGIGDDDDEDMDDGYHNDDDDRVGMRE